MENNLQGSAPSRSTSVQQRFRVEFSGKASEYFGIWIVNLALNVITLGIYSAWAKVRKTRYFYGNTSIAGEPFEYRANPIAILKGRIVAVSLFAVYSVVSELYPLFNIPLLIMLAFAAPWLVCRSLAFTAYNSAYRNVRFHFSGRFTSRMAPS